MSGQIRRAPGSDDIVPVAAARDESPPPGGGLFRRLAPGEGSTASVLMSGLDVVFAPSFRNAREELQRQRTAGARNPSDTDPPDGAEDAAGGAEGRVAAPGRPRTPFSGYIVLRRQAR